MTAAPPDPARRARMADTLARVADDFRQELPGRLVQARDLLNACVAAPADDATLQALLLQLHSLAGTSGTLGLAGVGDAARAGERVAQALRQQPGRTADDFHALQDRLEQLAARIHEACPSQP